MTHARTRLITSCLSALAVLAFTTATAQAKLAGYTKLVYGSVAEEEQLAVFPQSRAGSTVVMLVHGGAWHLQTGFPSIASSAQSLQDKGYVVFDVNYPQDRGSKSLGAFPRETQAVARALEYTKAHAAQYGGSPTNIVLDGESAGGNLVGLVADKKPELVRGVISLSGVMDLGLLAQEGRENELHGNLAHALGGVLECTDPATLEGCAEKFELENSPVSSIPANCPPWLLGSFSKDAVPVAGAIEMDKRLKARGCSSQLEIVSGKGHIPTLAKVGGLEFLQAH